MTKLTISSLFSLFPHKLEVHSGYKFIQLAQLIIL